MRILSQGKSFAQVFAQPRTIVLGLLWSLPIWLYIVVGVYAVFRIGWFAYIALLLPIFWSLAWLVARFWKPPTIANAARLQPMQAPSFWSPRDVAAVSIIEDFRSKVASIDRNTVADPMRYQADAQEMAFRLAKHYYSAEKDRAMEPLTLVEICSVIHLAVEDLEQWILTNVPGGHLVTVGLLQGSPKIVEGWDLLQKIFFVATTATNPAKLLSYPLWRLSGAATVEIQNEAIRLMYQQYLRLVGYYLIEMYSGRLRGGSKQYRQQFGHVITAIQKTGGDTSIFEQLQTVDVTIAVMGQVNAGKSSLINRLLQDKSAATNLLPETKSVERYEYYLPNSTSRLRLLDTPGYGESNVNPKQVREIQTASELADVVLLVVAANSPARQSDCDMLSELTKHYQKNTHLKPPILLVVLTHIDLLKPRQDWAPPYDWRRPTQPKEHSMANAVAYCRELFGDSISGYACVYTGDLHISDTSVADELVPLLADHLESGQSAAVLKAFYRQLSQQRYEKALEQFKGLFSTIRQAIKT